MQCEEQHQEEEEEEEAWKNRNNKKLKRHWTTRDASVMTATTRAPAASSRELPRWPRYLATAQPAAPAASQKSRSQKPQVRPTTNLRPGPSQQAEHGNDQLARPFHMPSLESVEHCTLHTAHCTLHTAHCTLRTAIRGYTLNPAITTSPAPIPRCRAMFLNLTTGPPGVPLAINRSTPVMTTTYNLLHPAANDGHLTLPPRVHESMPSNAHMLTCQEKETSSARADKTQAVANNGYRGATDCFRGPSHSLIPLADAQKGQSKPAVLDSVQTARATS
ncbi:hypothetical protein CFE70_006967 [Pyrenophora teres f. teres 0-1]